MESRIERLCIESGVKMTGQRRVVARVLSDATDHPNVEELYRRATAIDPRISIATVYRTVRLLEEKGILERRDFGEGRARYDPTDRGHHHHLIDIDTGKVIEFEDEEHEAVVKRIAERLGFTLVSQRLELFARRAKAEAGTEDQVRPEPPRAAAAARRPARPVPVARARRGPPPRGAAER
jgi:Fur family ferric uptake transcriptional regulator